MKREQILRVIEGAVDVPTAFLNLLESHANAKEAVDLGEFFQVLPRKQHGRLWTAVLPLTQTIAQRLGDGDGAGGEGETRKKEGDVELLSGVVTLCKCALSLDSPVITNDFTDTLHTIHGMLLSLPPEWCEVQNVMSEVCEMCWGREVEGREGIVPNCLLYILARTFSEGATKADVGRVWAMRGALLLLDFEDTSADSIKQLLLSTLIEPLYLFSDDGKKFLSFLFGLHPSFVEDLHCAIRNQLPWCPKPYLDIYGEVYFRAWRLASGPYLTQLEEHCLQDLMYCAVHATRTGSRPLFAALRKLLNYIHQQRQHKGVSEMLLRLYNPFLWRSLKVANSHVRANAACLMLDAFPLHDPNTTREDCDKVLQKQFDLMIELLADSSPMVRSLSVLGICRVLCPYWEMVPLPVVRSLLLRMIQDLAYDISSDNVRVAVLQGMCIILENRLSHSLLRELLPLLHNHIHDTSEKVRIAFVDLLLLVSGIRSIKFYEICPIDHLLVRMETDSVHVVKRIVSLLINSFQPANVPPYKQVARCIALIEINAGAARRFYQFASGHLPPARTVRFILALHQTLKHCIAEGGKGGEVSGDGEVDLKRKKDEPPLGEGEEVWRNHVTENVDEDGSQEGSGGEGEEEEEEEEGDPVGIAKGGWREEGAGENSDTSTEDPLTLNNRELLAGLLEVMVVLWEGVRERIATPKHRLLRSKLESTMAESLPTFFNALPDSRCRSALYLIGSYLPKKSVSSLVRGTLETISSLDPSSQEYSAMLVAMMSWKQCGHVIKMMSQALTVALDNAIPRLDGEGDTDSTTHAHPTRGRGKSKRQGKTGGPPSARGGSPQPVLALSLLNYMMLHPLCCQELKKEKETLELEKNLQRCQDVLETRLSLSHQTSPSDMTSDLLRQTLSVYLRLVLHRGAESEGECESVRERMREVWKWSNRILLPLLRGEISQPAKRHSNRKRKANQSQLPVVTSDPQVKEACKLVVVLLEVMSEAILIGRTDSELQLEMAQWAGPVAESISAHLVLQPLTKLLFQLSETSLCSELDGIKTPTGLIPTDTLLQPLLQLSANSASSGPDDFKKVWSQLQMCISNIVMMSVRMSALTISSHPLPTFTTLTNITMSSLVNTLKEQPLQELTHNLSSLPLFPSTVVSHVCRDEESTGVFASHLQSWLEEADDTIFPDRLLRHKAAVHVLSALASGGKGCPEIMGCVRCTLRLLERGKQETTTQWQEEMEQLTTAVEGIQDRLFIN